MKPKEKAKEIVDKFKNRSIELGHSYSQLLAEANALIAVDELIAATKKYVALKERVEYSKTGYDYVVHTQYDKFWLEVKQEIEKL